MFCFQCGQKLPDNSKFCINCGTKVINISNGDSTDVAKTEQGFVSFNFGKQIVKISKDYEPYIDVYKALKKNEEIKVKSFVNFYDSSVNSFDDILDRAIPDIYKKIQETLSFAVALLMDYGVDDVDEEQLAKILGNRIQPDSFLNIYYEQAEAIQSEIERINGYRTVERSTRGKWQGGGFGIGGAIKGAITAGAMNMATGAFRGIGDSIVNASDRNRIKKMKETAFSEQNNLQILVEGLGHACLVCFYGIYEILSKRNILPVLDMKTNTEETRISNHIKRNNYKEAISVIIECIQKNPFYSYPYNLLCEMAPMYEDEIQAIAHHYGVELDVDDEKNQEDVEDYTNEIEDAKNNKNLIDQLIKEMQFEKIVDFIKEGNLYAEYAVVKFFEDLCEPEIKEGNRGILDDVKDIIRNVPGNVDLLDYIYWHLCYRFGWHNDKSLEKEAEKKILDIALRKTVAAATVDRAFWGCQGYINLSNGKKEYVLELKKYADKGQPTAMAWLGIYYSKGQFGLSKDLLLAKKYLTIAATYGQLAAINELKKYR